ncbi:MAG: histidinol-phosphatase [Azospirillaceae bacterium]|nr:histidinol-phosphatase [Azospirillaceae bacterium]
MTQPCPAELIALAERLVAASGAVIRPYFRAGLQVVDKADLSPVTAADREAELAIRALITQARPQDGIIGEEFGRERHDSPYVWVIDPIDGTKSFITGRPIFATLIALLHEGRPILGVIDQPIIGDRWIGAAGMATHFNGKPAQVRSCGALDHAVLGTTSPDLFDPDDFARFRRVAGVAKLTMYGGDGYAYGLLAAGFADVIIEANLKLYDFAALVPVIEGAGGMITDWQGRALGADSDGRVLAAGDEVAHGAALELLAG